MVQAMQAGLLNNLIHAIIIDRGPLWLEGYGTPEHFEAFVKEYNRQFPKRWGRKRRFIPEMETSPNIDAIMTAHGFTKSAALPYQTIWLDLTQSLETLRGNLRKTWRQSLVKAEKSALEIEWDESGASLPWMLKHYQLDKQRRGYDGPDGAVLQVLGQYFAAEKKLLIGTASLDKKPVASILILMHGRSATYQIGWSTEDGKKHCAHHLLLWKSLGTLKAKGYKDFDLGGVNDGAAKTIKTFKSGLGGRLVHLAGLYV